MRRLRAIYYVHRVHRVGPLKRSTSGIDVHWWVSHDLKMGTMVAVSQQSGKIVNLSRATLWA